MREARRPSSASAGAVSLAPQRVSRPRATSRFSIPSGRRRARPCRLGSGRDLLGSQRVRHRVIYCGCCHRPAAGGSQPVGAGGALRCVPGSGSGPGAWLSNESHRRPAAEAARAVSGGPGRRPSLARERHQPWRAGRAWRRCRGSSSRSRSTRRACCRCRRHQPGPGGWGGGPGAVPRQRPGGVAVLDGGGDDPVYAGASR